MKRSPENLIGVNLKGEYRIQQEIGRGTFGITYLATRRQDNQERAIKVLRQTLSPEQVFQFAKEAFTILKLSHPHIIPVEHLDEEEGQYFFVMPYARRGSLRGHVPRGTAIAPEQALPLLVQTAEALQYAHDYRVVHRDVKPDNLLLQEHLGVWVTDFGIAVAAHGISSFPLNGTNVAGTPHYMAPEQFEGKPLVQVDQYALAVVAYELLVGQRPFEGNYQALQYAHTQKEPPSFAQQGAVMNPLLEALEPVVRKGLAKELHNRYPTIRAFAQDLQTQLKLATVAEKRAKVRKWFEVEVGIGHFKDGKDQEARQAYEEILQTANELLYFNPKDSEALTQKGYALNWLGKYEEALQALDEAIRLQPNDRTALEQQKYALDRLGRHKEAGVAKKRRRAEDYAEIPFDIRDPESVAEMLNALDEVLRRTPWNGMAIEWQVAVFKSLGREEEAIRQVDERIRRNPRDLDVYRSKGYVLGLLGRYEESLAVYEAVLQVNPQDRIAHASRIYTLYQLGRDQEVLAACDDLLRLEPADGLALYHQAFALHRVGRDAEALKACTTALRKEPWNKKLEALKTELLSTLLTQPPQPWSARRKGNGEKGE